MYAVIQLHYLYSEEMINKLFYFILFYSFPFHSQQYTPVEEHGVKLYS